MKQRSIIARTRSNFAMLCLSIVSAGCIRGAKSDDRIGAIRSPDGKQIALLLRENSRRRNSHVIFSSDEGATWSWPRELPGALTGDRHVGKYTPDGRLFITFRDMCYESPTQGD